MPHIPPLTRDAIDPTLLPLLDETERLMGFVPNDALTVARRPALFKALLDMTLAAYAPGAVSPQTKRLVGLAASLQAGCAYCQAHTLFSARKLGVSEDMLRRIVGGDYAGLEKPLRLALAFAARAAATPADVDDAFMAELKACYDEAEITELLAVIGLFGFLNRWNAGNRTDIEAAPQSCALDLQAR